jgi:hypothetical protein
MAEPRLVDSPGQCAGPHCFVIAAVFYHKNIAMAMAPILPYLLDLAPHEFFLFEQ